MNIVVTGYYYEKNLGDDLFLQIAQRIFTESRFKKHKLNVEKIQFVKIDLINTNEVKQRCDKIILFGGETLNDYFIDHLIQFKLKHNCNIYGIGVSCNQRYEELVNKINIFDYLVFRNKRDYEHFNTKFNNYCEYVPDIVFMIKNHLPLFNFKPKRVGLFLATPMFITLNQNEKNEYLKSIKQIIDYWLKKNFQIYFFAMSNSNKQKEDDVYVIRKIINLYSKKDHDNFRLCEHNRDILVQIKTMRYNICWRFHSIILSIINQIPFITFSSTPKVETLLKDNDIEDLGYKFSNIILGLDYLKTNKKSIIKRLKVIYKKNNDLTRHFYKNIDYLDIQRNDPPFYLTNKDIKKLIDTYIHQYKIYESTIEGDEDYNCNIILYLLNRTIDSEYHYGLREKIFKGIDNLIPEIKWLINDSINKNSILFYYAANSILKKIDITSQKNYSKINMNFINQCDMRGLHRSGWTYVLDNLSSLQDINGIYCDFYVDRTFHWNRITMTKLKVIPYRTPWIGFIHHTANEDYSDYNTVNLFKNHLFQQSLQHCKGLILLTEHLKNDVASLIHKMQLPEIPLFVLTHPTEFVPDNKMFTMSAFKSNENKKIIQIGAWMRDINGIFQIRLKNSEIKKAVLIGKKMEGYYANLNKEIEEIEEVSEVDSMIVETNLNSINSISRDNKIIRLTIDTKIDHQVEIITYLPDDLYDDLLSLNIVFLKLVDASAINTLLECIIRTTPIVINKIRPVVEVLGDDYPLFYNDTTEVGDLVTMKNIDKAHQYLKRMDKSKFKIEYFVKSFQNVLAQLK